MLLYWFIPRIVLNLKLSEEVSVLCKIAQLPRNKTNSAVEFKSI